MAIKYAERVREVASNKPNAANAFNLPDSAATGHQSFGSAFASGDLVPYMAANGTDWESGIGTFTAGSPDTLARTTILRSSTGSAIDFSSGANVDVFCSFPADKAEKLELQLDRGYTFVRNAVGATQSFTGGGFSKVSTCLNDVVANPHSWWNATDKKFIPDRPGVYSIFAGVQLEIASATIAQLAVYKNGSAEVFGGVWNQGNAILPTIETIASFNGSTDYIDLYIYVSGTVSNYNDLAGRVFFKAIYLGP